MPTAAPDPILAVLSNLLRPLVRLLVRRGVTFPVVSDLLRAVFVEEAEREVRGAGASAPTDSRISFLTGIHRKEVRRLRALPEATLEAGEALSTNTAILARWLGAPGYQDADGEPLALRRTADEDGRASFERLVTEVTTDVRPRTVLDDWVSRGLATVDATHDVVTLREVAFVPHGDEAAQLFFFGRNLHDHLAAACNNVVSRPPRFPDASVHYDGLTDGQARELEAIGRRAAARLLRDVNRAASALASTGSGGAHRVNVGVYLFSAPEAEQDGP